MTADTFTLDLSLQFFPVGETIATQPVTAKWICRVPYGGVICAGAYIPRIADSHPLWIKVLGDANRYMAVDTQRPFRIGAILTCPDCDLYVEGVRIVTNVPLGLIDDCHQSQESRRTWASFSSWPTSPVFDYAVVFEVCEETIEPCSYGSVTVCDLATGSLHRLPALPSSEPYTSIAVRNELPDLSGSAETGGDLAIVTDPCTCHRESLDAFDRNKSRIMPSSASSP